MQASQSVQQVENMNLTSVQNRLDETHTETNASQEHTVLGLDDINVDRIAISKPQEKKTSYDGTSKVWTSATLKYEGRQLEFMLQNDENGKSTPMSAPFGISAEKNLLTLNVPENIVDKLATFEGKVIYPWIFQHRKELGTPTSNIRNEEDVRHVYKSMTRKNRAYHNIYLKIPTNASGEVTDEFYICDTESQNIITDSVIKGQVKFQVDAICIRVVKLSCPDSMCPKHRLTLEVTAIFATPDPDSMVPSFEDAIDLDNQTTNLDDIKYHHSDNNLKTWVKSDTDEKGQMTTFRSMTTIRNEPKPILFRVTSNFPCVPINRYSSTRLTVSDPRFFGFIDGIFKSVCEHMLSASKSEKSSHWQSFLAHHESIDSFEDLQAYAINHPVNEYRSMSVRLPKSLTIEDDEGRAVPIEYIGKSMKCRVTVEFKHTSIGMKNNLVFILRHITVHHDAPSRSVPAFKSRSASDSLCAPPLKKAKFNTGA